MQLDLKKVNEILKDLNKLIWNDHPNYTLIETLNGFHHDYEVQGDPKSGITKIYDVGLDDVKLKVVIESDSYGDNESITAIAFVKPQNVTVTQYVEI